MSNKLKADLKSFILPFKNDKGEDAIAYIPMPTQDEMKSVSRVLGMIFTYLKKQEVDELVLMQDWDIYVEELLTSLPNGQAIKDNLEAFFDRKIVTSNIFIKDTGLAMESLSDDETKVVRGSYLFFSSLYRYAAPMLKGKDMRGLYTSQSALEYQELLKKRHDERLAKDLKELEKSQSANS